MKRFLIALATLLAVYNAQAQDSLKIDSEEPQMEDVLTLLDAMDIYLYRFNAEEFLKHKYNVSFFVDEYMDGVKKERRNTLHMGANIQSVKIYPREQWDAARKQHGLGPDEDDFVRIKTVSIIVRKNSDTTAMATFASPGAGRMGVSLEQYPAGPDSVYFYSSRPFTLEAVPDTGAVEIPLVLYGSGWYDERYNIVRFCGESRIDPQLKADILKNLPHYYILGVTFTPKEEL